MSKNTYQNRKENGLCVRCGKCTPEKGKVMCAECSKKQNVYQKKMRDFRKKLGFCPRCGKNKLFGEENACPECNAKEYVNTMNSRKKNGKEHYNRIHSEWSKKEHQRRIEHGICTRCGKRRADFGFKTCSICRIKIREEKRIRYGKPDRRERYEKALCYFCDNPIKEGYKVCEKHYQMNLQKLNNEKCRKATEETKNRNSKYFKN